jgi:UDP:flavonoid glycosyltransferase YjiC (YdhE family)
MSTACAGRGVARVVALDEVSNLRIDAAVGELVDDDRFRRKACDVAREIAEMPEPDAAVPWLETAGPT